MNGTTRNAIIFWALVPTTLMYLAATVLEFHGIGAVKIHWLLTLTYAILLAAYAADNEVRKICEAKKRPRKGQWFVYAWIAVSAYMGAASTFFPNTWSVPSNHGWLFGQVVALFGATTILKENKKLLQEWILRRVAPPEP